MNGSTSAEIESSRRKILASLPYGVEITFIRLEGNVGDQLIYAGIRKLLAGVHYREIGLPDVATANGDCALVAGSGGWCHAYHSMPEYQRAIERNFETVVVLPSSFDVSVESVKRALMRTKATVFAREQQSYDQIRSHCRAELAHDCAFFFDFGPYQRHGEGILNAFRTDLEAGPYTLPADNNDISLTCETLDEWLWTIACHDTIRTDRAHVTIAAAMLGKRVLYRPSNYHKVTGIVQFALSGFPVQRLADDPEFDSMAAGAPSTAHGELLQANRWKSDSEEVARDLAAIVSAGASLILVDNGLLDLPRLAGRRVIPFTERGGTYWGPPPDDATALFELQRLLQVGPACVAFAWPAFWWLEHYPSMREYLEQSFPCVRRDERLIVFDLRSVPSMPSGLPVGIR